jgi:hypothetical protein
VRDLRKAGWSAADVIGRAAAHVGLLDRERALRAEEVSSAFQPSSSRPADTEARQYDV